MKKFYLLSISALLTYSIASAQSFVDVGAGFPGISSAHAAWGDYDNDRDPDLLISGELSNGTPIVKLFSNTDDGFTENNTNFTGMTDGAVAWADYDNDGDLDILTTGENPQEKSLIYKNDNGSFTALNSDLNYFGAFSFACWGDFDNDGDPDPFLTGQWQSELYINEEADQFSPSGYTFAGLSSGRACWYDLEGDGDLDLVLTGDTGGGMKLFVYTNQDGIFTETIWENMGLSAGSIALGDYDSDGDADLLITGYDDYIAPKANVYRNDGNAFTNIWAGLAPVSMGNAAWGDYDNDGDLDIALTGKLAGCGVFATEVYENVGNDYFNSINAGLTPAENSSISWVDFDNDTDLDILLSGNDYYGNSFTRLYRNDVSLPNFTPEAPENLTVELMENSALLSWADGSDIQTPVSGLTYNLRIGTEPGGCDILSPMSHLSDGYRKIFVSGNVSQSKQWKLNEPEAGKTYYWSVQTIDNTYAASEFSDEHNFTYILTGIYNKVDSNNEIQISPNPAYDKIGFMGLEPNDPFRVQILSTSGTLMLSKNIRGNQEINLEELAGGIYFVILENNSSRIVKKLMIR